MAKSWENLEAHVRTLASYLWDRESGPKRLAGVDIDCVLEVSRDRCVLIEITEERSLDKVRGDILKLVTARNALFTNENTYAQCYCVVGSHSITDGMREAGVAQKITVMSLSSFERQFFDFASYKMARLQRQFGSAVDPITGKSDEIDYTPVTYQHGNGEVTIAELCDILLRGKKVILLGEYGSGKSRCAREVFVELAARASDTGIYPISIDLRDNWGLRRAREIVSRHFEDMGLESLSSRVMRCIDKDFFIFILDGFDELGFQAWSDDSDRLKNTRMRSLQGVRDLVKMSHGSVLISGREHYFNSNADMLSALGIVERDSLILRSKSEFSQSEMAAYLSKSRSRKLGFRLNDLAGSIAGA